MNKLHILAATLFSAVSLISCDKLGTNNGNSTDAKNITISGYAQKGQFIKGSNITAYALSDDTITPTGESYPTTIKDDIGSFSLSAKIPTSYIELRAEGYYFNENLGKISEAPIYLNAFVSTNKANGEINVNLMTTLTSNRIKALLKQGKTYNEAKEQAENEVLKAFDLQSANLEGKSFEDMNISEDGNANAILLAASCLIQQDRSSGEIQKLISDLSSSFETSGTISEKLYDEILGSSTVSISSVVENLLAFYNDRDVKSFEIPAFYGILNEDYKSGFHKLGPSVINSIETTYNTEAEGITRDFIVISYQDFKMETSEEWIKTNVTKICNRLYNISITIEPNENDELRTGYANVVLSNGDVVLSEEVKQIGTLKQQRLFIKPRESSTRAAWMDRDQVNVNGQVYQVSQDPATGLDYVDVPFNANGYGMAEVAEIMPNPNDVLSPEVYYIGYVDDYYAIENDTRFKTPYYYGALKPFRDIPISNPATIELKLISAFVTITITDKTTGEPINFKSIQIETDEDVMLSGYITDCVYPEEATSAPTYRDASYKLTIVWVKNGNYVGFQMPPRQTIQTLRVKAYSGNQLSGTIVYDDIIENMALTVNAGCQHKISLKK